MSACVLLGIIVIDLKFDYMPDPKNSLEYYLSHETSEGHSKYFVLWVIMFFTISLLNNIYNHYHWRHLLTLFLSFILGHMFLCILMPIY